MSKLTTLFFGLVCACAESVQGDSSFEDTSPLPVDRDNDGWSSDQDCNDDTFAINPDAQETCNGLDDNCNGAVDEEACAVDVDGDGWSPPADCDDDDEAVHPGVVELCDGEDSNCDPTDEGEIAFFADRDKDGFGDRDVQVRACSAPSGFVLNDEDCDDGDGSVHPGQQETCGPVDQNCNGAADEPGDVLWYYDGDGDSFGTVAAIAACAPLGAYQARRSGDCNDSNSSVFPGAPELCNNVDDNCDGSGDAGWALRYADQDRDGFGGLAAPAYSCAPSGVYTATRGGDCDDGNATRYPGAPELCNGMDNDCAGDEDFFDPSANCSAINLQFFDDDCNLGCGTSCPAGSGSGLLETVPITNRTFCVPLSRPRRAAQMDFLRQASCPNGKDLFIELYAGPNCTEQFATVRVSCSRGSFGLNLNCVQYAGGISAADQIESIALSGYLP